MSVKEDYLKKIEAQIKEWSAKIDELKEKGVKGKYDEIMENLIAKRETAQNKLQELKKSSDEAWVDIKVGLENARDELKEALEKAVSQFKS